MQLPLRKASCHIGQLEKKSWEGLCCWFDSSLFLCSCYEGIWIICFCFFLFFYLCSFHTWLLWCWDSRCLASNEKYQGSGAQTSGFRTSQLNLGHVLIYFTCSRCFSIWKGKALIVIWLLQTFERKLWGAQAFTKRRTCAAPHHPMSVLPHFLCLLWHFFAPISKQAALTKWAENEPEKRELPPDPTQGVELGSTGKQGHLTSQATVEAAKLQKMPPAPARVLQPGPSPSPTRNHPVLTTQGAELGLNRAARAGPKEPTKKIHLL